MKTIGTFLKTLILIPLMIIIVILGVITPIAIILIMAGWVSIEAFEFAAYRGMSHTNQILSSSLSAVVVFKVLSIPARKYYMWMQNVFEKRSRKSKSRVDEPTSGMVSSGAHRTSLHPQSGHRH